MCVRVCARERERKRGGRDRKKDESRQRERDGDGYRERRREGGCVSFLCSCWLLGHWVWHKMTHSKLGTFCIPQQQPCKEHFVKLSTGAAESRRERSCDTLLHNRGSKTKFPWIIKSPDLLNLALRPETLRINSAGPNGTSGYPTLYSPPPPPPCFSRNNSDEHRGIRPKAKMWVNKTSSIRLFHW